jgi:hypothetical protein
MPPAARAGRESHLTLPRQGSCPEKHGVDLGVFVDAVTKLSFARASAGQPCAWRAPRIGSSRRSLRQPAEEVPVAPQVPVSLPRAGARAERRSATPWVITVNYYPVAVTC